LQKYNLFLKWYHYYRKKHSKINLHPKNIENHRAYSAATMKYIRFLNDGKKYGHRIDLKKPRGKKNDSNSDE
jgi:hypothetical protein